MIRNVLIVAIIFLGGILLFTQDLRFSNQDQQKPLGTIESIKGLVLGKSQENENFVNLTEKAAVSGPLQIVTGFESEAQLQFGESFKVLENSSVHLYKSANQYFVEVVRGSVQRTKPEDNVAFRVQGQAKQGLTISAPSHQSLTTLRPIENVAQDGGTQFETTDEFQVLLTETVKLHQRFFEKCFIKLYEKHSGEVSAGLVNTRFSIDRKGHVSSVSILKSDFSDEDFRICIEEVVSRVQFKGYNEAPRTIDFPIQFNLPN